ncbi:putative salicylate hydroxylase, partial [Jackrogersella minutella]
HEGYFIIPKWFEQSIYSWKPTKFHPRCSSARMGVRVLSYLGFDFARAEADDMVYFEIMDCTTLQPLDLHSLDDPQQEFGSPLYTVHRADLINELLYLAPDLDIRLGSKAEAADAEQGLVCLEDGTWHYADLIVAADGVHSFIRVIEIPDQVSVADTPSKKSAFRFMIPTPLRLRGKTEHHMGLQPFVGTHDSMETCEEDLKAAMLKEFSHYHPGLTHVIGIVTCWPLFIHDPLPIWHRSRILLIGDAAHPMLPLGAQEANRAIEDEEIAAQIPRRLALFEEVRRLRALRIQILFKIRLGKEKDVAVWLFPFRISL